MPYQCSFSETIVAITFASKNHAKLGCLTQSLPQSIFVSSVAALTYSIACWLIWPTAEIIWCLSLRHLCLTVYSTLHPLSFPHPFPWHPSIFPPPFLASLCSSRSSKSAHLTEARCTIFHTSFPPCRQRIMKDDNWSSIVFLFFFLAFSGLFPQL